MGLHKVIAVIIVIIIFLVLGLAAYPSFHTMFDSGAVAGDTSILRESYITGDDTVSKFAGLTWEAQTFTIPAIAYPPTVPPGTPPHIISAVILKLSRVGSPGTITVSINTVSGAGDPTGADLCYGTTDGNTLPVTPASEWRVISISSAYHLVANTQYAIVCRAPSGVVATDYVDWAIATVAPLYAGGKSDFSADGGVTWVPGAARDFMFKEMQGMAPLVSVGIKSMPYILLGAIIYGAYIIWSKRGR